MTAPRCEHEGCTEQATHEVDAAPLMPGVGTFLCADHTAEWTEANQ